MPLDTLTTGEIARLLDVSPAVVVRWIDRGSLGYHLPASTHHRATRADVRQFCIDNGLAIPDELVEVPR